MPRDNNDLGMAPKTTEVRTTITPAILVQMGQVRNPSAFTQRIDVDKLIARYNHRLDNKVMKV